MTRNSGQGDFQCPVCRKRFSDPELLIQHHSTHDGDNFAPAPTSDSASVSTPAANGRSHPEIDNVVNEIKELKAQLLQKEHDRKHSLSLFSKKNYFQSILERPRSQIFRTWDTNKTARKANRRTRYFSH
jgi:uncharacterized Zn-finger protein